MVSRKRGRAEMEAEAPAEEPSMLHKLRNMWTFANLAQYIALFKGALKIDADFDIEELETECLKPQPSEKLAEIGLALLKHISSHKGLTPDIFDEYARRQFVAKAPSRNPFGTDDAPNKFNEFDIYTKIRVLQQLSIWTLNNPNTIRERVNPTEVEQINWRTEPYGWDSQDRTLFVLDDFRLYRQTDPPPPAPPPKAKSKVKARKSKSTRTSKRRKLSTPEPDEPAEDDGATEVQDIEEAGDDGLGGTKWECICVTMVDYQDYLSSMRKSKDQNEKNLFKRIEEEILPELEKVAEEQVRKELRKMRELETLQKLATAKRSSRISARVEKQKEVEQSEEVQRRRQTELTQAKAEQEKQQRMEEAHESRRQTREQRIREREAAKIMEEENLRKLQDEQERLASGEARLSERHLHAQMKKTQRELKKLKEKEYWIFDCEKCSMRGACLNDGSHQIQCEKCEEWQHSQCHNIPPEIAAKEDFVFICASCRREGQASQEPKLPPLKLRLTSASPSSSSVPRVNGSAAPGPAHQLEAVRIPVSRLPPTQSPPRPVQTTSLMDGPSLSPQGQALGPPGIQRSEVAYGSPLGRANGSSPPRPHPSETIGAIPFGRGLPTSSPPRYRNPESTVNPFNTVPQQNGSPFAASRSYQPAYSTPYTNNFNRPTSAAGPAGSYQPSPIKHSPAPSPRPTNGVPNAYNFNSPHSSFPPSSTQGPAFSPTKHSSPPPSVQHMSSPAPAPIKFAASPNQMPAQMLPNPIPAPSKHDSARPVSSHTTSERMVLPPIKSLSPIVPAQNLSPPTKKTSPTPERPQFAPVSGNGFGSPQ